MSNPTRSAFGAKPFKRPGVPCGLEDAEVVELTTGTVLGKYDLVIMTGTGNADSKAAKVARIAATSDKPSHVFLGPVNQVESDIPNYYDGVAAAQGLAIPLVHGMEFEMMEDADGGSLSETNIGQAIDIATVSNASSTTGYSAMVLDSSSAAQGASKLFILKRLARYVNNEEGTYAVWVVGLNETQLEPNFVGV